MLTKKMLTIVAAALLAVMVSTPVFAAASYYRVQAHSTDRFDPVWFAAGRTVQVIVNGDGDTDLDLYVYDDHGNLIVKDDDNSDDCVVSFTVLRGSYFYIAVKNRGGVYNNYRLTIR